MARRDTRVHYYCQPRNIGMIANFSYAIESAPPPYFSMLCDDDLLLPRFYEIALASFEAHPEAAFVSTSVILMNEQGMLTDIAPTMPAGFYLPPGGLLAMAKFSKAWFAGTLYRRDIVDSVGAHDQQLSGASDVDFDLRLAARYPIFVTAEPGAVFSVHASSTSVKARHDFVWRDMLKIIDKLSQAEDIPLASRTLACQILAQKLEQYMFQLGIVYTLRGNWNEARKVADTFRTHYDRRDKAFFLSALTTVSQHIPPIYQLSASGAKGTEISAWKASVSNPSRVTARPCLDQQRSIPCASNEF